MTKEAHIGIWNIEQALCREDNYGQTIEGIKQLDVDLMVCPEPFTTGMTPRLDDLESLGYAAHIVPYGEPPESSTFMRHPVHDEFTEAYLVLDRIGARIEPLTTAWRDLTRITVEINGEEIVICGAHLDDRTNDIRNLQVDVIQQERPDIVMGDLNAMRQTDVLAPLLASGLFTQAAKLIPHPKYRSLAGRMQAMADGTTMRRLENLGYRDALPANIPTIKIVPALARSGFIAIDHMMVHKDSPAMLDQVKIHHLPGPDHNAATAILRAA